jgi:hypothetical protein
MFIRIQFDFNAPPVYINSRFIRTFKPVIGNSDTHCTHITSSDGLAYTVVTTVDDIINQLQSGKCR